MQQAGDPGSDSGASLENSAAGARAASFMRGGGVMGDRLRAFDWASTSLGASEGWPQSLRAAVRIMLTSRFAMWMAWGPELVFFCNDAYLPTTGVRQNWVLGARSDVVWAEIWQEVSPRIEHVLRSGEATWDEQLLLYLERSGFSEETYHTFSYSPLFGDAGETAGMLCVVAEVTERVIGERQLGMLRDLGAQLSAAATRTQVMAAFTACLAAETRDVPFALVYLLQTGGEAAVLAALHGLPAGHPAAPPEVTMRDGTAVWPLAAVPHDGALVQPGLAVRFDGLPTSSPRSLLEQALILKLAGAEGDAPLGFLIAGLNPHREADASYRGFLQLVAGQLAAAIARADTFEQERARAEALAELDRAKTVFFANVSHEFRTPLTLMLGPLEDVLEARETLPPAMAERVVIAHRNGLRLLRLVNTLLDFARIEAGRSEASFRPVDLARLTTELASTFESTFDRAGLSLQVRCDALDEPAYVDRVMWEKIVLNLLSNAFKFTLRGGAAVRQFIAGPDMVLEVEDTGVGIAAGELPHLFDRFHRVENAGGRSFEGSGIGLALVRDLIALHGGSITARSEPGRGTVFRVALPRGMAHLPPDRVSERADPGEATRAREFVDEAARWLPDDVAALPAVLDDVHGLETDTARGVVLIADDNADLRDYVGSLLRARGYTVRAVADGAAALAHARAQRPDLLLTDVMMPGMNGFVLLAEIRADAALADLPVVMLSARAGPEAQVGGLEAGADDYLSKPFSARELLARVSANLDMARVRRQAAEAVRASEARLAVEREFLAHVLAKAPIGIAIMNGTGQVVSLNERGIALLGHRHETADFDDFVRTGGVHADGTPYRADEYPATRAARGEHIEGERLIHRRDGGDGAGQMVLEVDAAPIRDDSGGLAGAVVVFGDAGARDRAEEELRGRVDAAVHDREAALAQLHEIAKLETIGQLTGGVAHDFNNLLTPIMGSLDLLRLRVADDARSVRHLDIALQAAERSRTLIQRLLAFARRTNLQALPVDVGALLNGMRDFLQRTIGMDILLAISAPPGLPPAWVDANQLELAILNLCVNARDAMPDGGTLTLTAWGPATEAASPTTLAPGNYVAISAGDTGAGMDAATLARAIEPFFTTKPQGQGTGLGLSMVHGLAAQSGGAFVLESVPAQGTRATLYLPLATQAVTRPAPDATAPAPGRATDSVLLVDDEPIVRETTADMLTASGYKVTQAGSAAEAIRLVDSGLRPRIVVTDQKMPGMSGTELAAVLRQRLPGVPILLISGYTAALDETAADLPRLAKPFRQNELIGRVNALCEAGV